MNLDGNPAGDPYSDINLSFSRKVDLIHIAHVIYALRTGGLENGLVNLINRMPEDRYRHSIVCITDYDEFSSRINKRNVSIFPLYKKKGLDTGLYLRLWRLFRNIRPDIVHTRNLAALESQIPAFFAGVPWRLHGEHGRGIDDPDGTVKKYQWIRKVCSHFIHHFITLSGELEYYLEEKIRVPPDRITRICNGVDIEKFRPSKNKQSEILKRYFGAGSICIGYVGRMDPVKDPITLVKAFIILATRHSNLPVRLVMTGDGPLKETASNLLQEAGILDFAWFTGKRNDVAEIMRGLDMYALPSLAEGISNTLLEAMASGLPTVATRVGGNAELAVDEETALLVDRDDPESMAQAIERYLLDRKMRHKHGRAARARTEAKYSIDKMVDQYIKTYDTLAKSLDSLEQ